MIRNHYPQYLQGNFFEKIIKELKNELEKSFNNNDFKRAIYCLEGKNSTPIMTMHKSKGLEFHTIIFIGLEDSALWGYNENPVEETNGFFVSFSRTIYRIIFTFSTRRNRKTQTKKEISPLYDLLKSANLEIQEIT